MPNLRNAKKALRQSQKKAVANLKVKKAFKSAIKDAKKSIGSADIKDKVKFAQKKLDKAAKKGVIKKNAAARKLSRLMKKVNTGAK